MTPPTPRFTARHVGRIGQVVTTETQEFEKTAQFVAGICNSNRDYVVVWVQPKGEPGRKYRLSVTGAASLIAELSGAIAQQVSA
jgi:hypothetical protein